MARSRHPPPPPLPISEFTFPALLLHRLTCPLRIASVDHVLDTCLCPTLMRRPPQLVGAS
ncbi:Protein kinase domain-containing protein [Psidium guajava]|nr:Protein kinase domain-containing protein [Psidium guajava]